jgi:hypothetical protein
VEVSFGTATHPPSFLITKFLEETKFSNTTLFFIQEAGLKGKAEAEIRPITKMK